MIQQSLFTDKPRGPKLLFDVTARKHKNAPASVEANLRTNKSDGIRRIVEFMRTCPYFTSHLKEIVRETGMLVQTVSARLSDMKAMRPEPMIEVVDGERREKCCVIRLK